MNAFYLLCGGGLLLVLLLPWDEIHGGALVGGGKWTQSQRTAFNALQRSTFGASFVGIVYGMFCGDLPLIAKPLSLPMFESIGKLSYGAYMYHLVILQVYVAQYKSFVNFYPSHLAFVYLAILLLAFITSYFSYLLIERPFSVLWGKFIQRLTTGDGTSR
mmetsp:Transcript_24838/g.44167  ORF Transcript_24838/g.44167 Transcript_24838/m.44167 type:complete len:160 (+) Transcript_24838:96-575(+)